jgi:phospholipase/carboxylesterase
MTLPTIEIEPSVPARASVILMHGLGADAHDFEPIVPALELPQELAVRFVFPNAPQRSITVNGGMRMRAWYDIAALEIDRRPDEAGVRESEAQIVQLIRREVGRGIPTERIVLAGFSQGGAMALHTGLRYPEQLAGILALSCYLLLPESITQERHPANQETPIFLAHGRFDPVVPYALGEAARMRLQALGYNLQWQDYPMQHEVVWEEVQAIGAWLRQVLARD